MPDSSPRVARLDHHRNARLLPAARSVDRWEVNLTEPPDGHARLSHLDGLRGLAALNVMAGHAVIACDYALYSGARADSWGAWDITVSAWPLLLPVAGANFSVCVFLVLSGFVLAHAFIRTSLGPPALAVKRTVRLGLPILAVTLMSWALLAAGCGANHRVAPISHSRWLDVPFAQAPDFGAAVRDGLFGNLVLHVPNATSYDASLWTMPIEFAGSLLLIVCFWAGRSGLARAGSRRLGGLALLMAGAITYPAYVSLMLFGAALYVLRRPGPVIREKRDPLRSIRWGGLALIALVLGTVPFSEARGPYWNALAALAPPAPFAGLWPPGLPGALAMSAEAIWHGIGAVVLVSAIDRWPSARSLLCRPLPQLLGRISFPLYLVHIPLLMTAGCGTFLAARRAGVAPAAAAALAVGTFTVVSFAAAILAVRFIERPAIALAARLARGVQAGLKRAWNDTRRSGTAASTPAPARRA